MVDNAAHSDRRKELPISRRKLLVAASTAGIIGMAGCSGTNTQNSNGTDGGDMILDEAQDTSTPPRDINWNPFAAEGYNGNVAGWMFEWGAVPFHEDGKLRGWGYKDWTYNEKKNVFTTTLRDDLKKWNGNSFTAEDVYVYDEMVRLQAPESSAYNRIELTSDNAINYHMKKPINANIFAKTELLRVFNQGKGLWQSWLERYQDATTQQARETITEDLLELKISNEEFIKNGRGTGAFKLTKVSDTAAVMDVWDEHRNADKISHDKHRIHFTASQSRYGELLTNDKADIGRGPFPQKYKGPAPDYLENLTSYSILATIKVLINWKNRSYLQDVNVRRAMAAVINTTPIAEATGNGKPLPVHSGMDPAFNEEFIGSDIGKYIDYKPTKSAPTLADEFLARSGYTRQNGTVVGPDGAPLEKLRFVDGTEEQWHITGLYASRQLKEYGFPIEYKTTSRGTKLDIISEKKSMDEWDLSTSNHYAPTLHPFSFFDYKTFYGLRLGEATWSPAPGLKSNIRKWLSEGKEYSPYNGKPLTPEIPTMIGQQDLSGKTKELNIFELVNEIQKPTSEERENQIIQDLSWMWNFHLPDIDTYVLLGGMWGDTKHFEWTNKKWPYTGVNNAGVYWVANHGMVKPKAKK